MTGHRTNKNDFPRAFRSHEPQTLLRQKEGTLKINVYDLLELRDTDLFYWICPNHTHEVDQDIKSPKISFQSIDEALYRGSHRIRQPLWTRS